MSHKRLSAATGDAEMRADLAKRVETTPVDGKFGTRLFAMSDAECNLVVRLLRETTNEEMVPRKLLDCRDDFIANKGLWSEFLSTLPGRPE